MARRVSATPGSPERYVVGPGILVANAPTNASGHLIYDAAAKRISLTGATLLGALDEGNSLTFAVEFEYTRLEKARGLIGNIGVPRLTQANASITGTMLEFDDEKFKFMHPGMTTANWMDNTATTPAKVGVVKTPTGYVTNSDQLTNVVMIGERPNAADGVACLIKRGFNESNFELSLEADETESSTEVNFTASYDIADHDAATGAWKPPYQIYLLTPAAAV